MLHQRAWHVVITKYRFRKVSQQVWIADGKGHTEGRESVLQGGKRSTDFEITASSKSSAKCRKQWMKGHIAYFWIRKVSCRCRTLYLGRAHSSNRGITASGRFWGGCGLRWKEHEEGACGGTNEHTSCSYCMGQCGKWHLQKGTRDEWEGRANMHGRIECSAYS
jgi:hypothetical protein